MVDRSVMEPTVLLLVSFPCTIGFELRSCDPGAIRKDTPGNRTRLETILHKGAM